MFLGIKSLVSRCGHKMQFGQSDAQSRRLTDVLSRHFWDSNYTQWALNNLICSLLVHHLAPTKSLSLLVAVSGYQVFSQVTLLTWNLFAPKRKINAQIASFFLFYNLFAANFFLPIATFVYCYIALDKSSLPFQWVIIFAVNSLASIVNMGPRTSFKLLKYASDPDLYRNAFMRQPAKVVKECPTRNFSIGNEIYTFCFFLCQKKKILRKVAFLE